MASVPPESVPLPAREQQSRHDQHRDTRQSYPDGIHDLRQNPPISKPSPEVFDREIREPRLMLWHLSLPDFAFDIRASSFRHERIRFNAKG